MCVTDNSSNDPYYGEIVDANNDYASRELIAGVLIRSDAVEPAPLQAAQRCILSPDDSGNV